MARTCRIDIKPGPAAPRCSPCRAFPGRRDHREARRGVTQGGAPVRCSNGSRPVRRAPALALLSKPPRLSRLFGADHLDVLALAGGADKGCSQLPRPPPVCAVALPPLGPRMAIAIPAVDIVAAPLFGRVVAMVVETAAISAEGLARVAHSFSITRGPYSPATVLTSAVARFGVPATRPPVLRPIAIELRLL
jgi:hypothetical protein